MRVLAVADKLSTGHYRARQPAAALAGSGCEVDIAEGGLQLETRGGLFHHVNGLIGYDVLLLLRPSYPFMVNVIDHAQRRGIKVVVDADDDLHSVHSLNRAFDAVNELPGADFKWFRECCKRADLVTVSTPALAQRYGSHGR